ncbi:RapZ C-terminal domain-containing protein [Microbacter margulisiae]|uniref:Aminoglycoside/choline kinase family phosphotransferase n=1 Tax=Microbacter margulisiae TaxID=1350067 RepID=A0A7W5DMX0_9PORP|nr:RNase adapter RapZ [Microbacter margulisiae]MBB3185860.1 aminoglycoside/choline kinase family phosphotransferase [Microbacter margulisiae]
MDTLKYLFEQVTGKNALEMTELPSSGSNRRYFRLSNENVHLIGVHGASAEENRAFWSIDLYFVQKGLPVPKVLIHSDDFQYYLQEDLGDTLLFKAIEAGRNCGQFNDEEKLLLKKTIRMLPAFQMAGNAGFDFSVCYPESEFDKRMILWDLNYFKYCFLKATGLEFHESALEDDFERFSQILLADESITFLYRDFQSRNVMIVKGEPYFIDFQGGRKGPIYYDVASFLWQARAQYSDELREELLQTYLDALKKYMPVNEENFRHQLQHFVIFRTLQVLGAYGFRGYFEKKPHFLQSVPYAIDNLRRVLPEESCEYPYLCNVLSQLTQMKQYADVNWTQKLEVRIYSFAYKKGIPDDASGNGGGYVFDCRGINNPGKYEHFRHFTGLDKEVIDFLEDDGGIEKFLDHVYALADVHVQRYIERKFSHLMFAFGCTGGQHRSVYSAQHLAEHIAKKFDVRVTLLHRELNIEKTF